MDECLLELPYMKICTMGYWFLGQTGARTKQTQVVDKKTTTTTN